MGARIYFGVCIAATLAGAVASKDIGAYIYGVLIGANTIVALLLAARERAEKESRDGA